MPSAGELSTRQEKAAWQWPLIRVLPCSRFAYVKPGPINALAKLRDDKAVPDGWDVGVPYTFGTFQGQGPRQRYDANAIDRKMRPTRCVKRCVCDTKATAKRNIAVSLVALWMQVAVAQTPISQWGNSQSRRTWSQSKSYISIALRGLHPAKTFTQLGRHGGRHRIVAVYLG
jgi:hypothetical protein